MSTNYGVQTDGSFDRKHIDTIRDDIETKMRQELGEDIDLDHGSPYAAFVDTVSAEVAEQWEIAEQNYYAGYFEDAFGVQLDKILALAGVGRLPRRGATGAVVFSTDAANQNDVPIQQDTVVTTESSPAIPFKTTQMGTLVGGSLQTDPIPIRALQPWETTTSVDYLGEETNVQANTITNIADPISGITAVTNPEPTGDRELGYVNGRDEEIDAEYKRRYKRSLGGVGSATLDAISGNVYDPDKGITNVDIEENVTMVDNTGSGGLPPKSFRITTLGGLADTIAQKITDKRAAGIESYGSLQGTSELDSGDLVTEHFERATQVDIYVDVTVDKHSDVFPGDGGTQIQDSIIRYIGGSDSMGVDYDGLGIANDVLWDMVHSASMNVTGTQSVTVAIGTADDPTGTDDIVINDGTVARTSTDKVDVTVTI